MLHDRIEQPREGTEFVLPYDAPSSLISILRSDGFQVIAPAVIDGAITLHPVDSELELATGFSDDQSAGSYRLLERADNAIFACGNGPRSPKDFVRSSSLKLFEAHSGTADLEFIDLPGPESAPVAFVGVRSCDIEALHKLRGVLDNGQCVDPEFRSRTQRMLVIAVECGRPTPTCFCTSMGLNPRPSAGYDVLLSELLEGEHRFLATSGSEAGSELLHRISHNSPTKDDFRAAEQMRSDAALRITRTINIQGLRDSLLAATEPDHWQAIATRCLACGNCTQVCPTCFCFTVEDCSDLTGNEAARWRKSDSCFTLNFSYIHGGSVRASVSARYRQWVMHKFVYWLDQFGTSGCTGCGRCITWCPAAIDLTQELEALRAHARR